MKRLKFVYHMKLTFSDAVRDHRFSLKCIPHFTDMQRIKDVSISVYPDHITSEDTDSHGNITLFGYTNEYHNFFGFEVSGLAVTGLSDYEKAGELHKVGMYKYQTGITRPGEGIINFFKDLDLAGLTNESKAQLIMEKLAETFKYEQGVTDMSTTAEQAFLGGSGVCQDYSHIMLSLCRMEKIPCRYVAGMMMGEGSSHAWVEIWDENRWLPFDPTNNKRVGDEYIKISGGRDAGDCLVNQGIFIGNVTQKQEINVLVEEVLDESYR